MADDPDIAAIDDPETNPLRGPSGRAEARRSPFRAAVDWAGEHIAAIVTLIGAVAYVFLRLAFVTFYRRFGVTPEDVGYDYGTVLTTTLPGVALIGGAILTAVAIMLALNLAVRRRLLHEVEPHPYPRSYLPLALAVTAAFWTAVVIGVVWIVSVDHAAERARRGTAIDGVNVLAVPLFPWSVRPASIHPVTRDASRLASDLTNVCGMYLGSANSTHIVFDARHKEVLRLPVAAVRIDVGKWPTGCATPR